MDWSSVAGSGLEVMGCWVRRSKAQAAPAAPYRPLIPISTDLT